MFKNQHGSEKYSIWDRNFIQYIFNLMGAFFASLVAYTLWWYGPIIAFPFYLFAAPKLMKKKPINIAQVYIMRAIYLVAGIMFIVFQAIIFQMHIGSWYGWLVGALSSWIILGILAAHLDDWLKSKALRGNEWVNLTRSTP